MTFHLPSLLRQFHIHAKKSLGQNFLAEEGALRKIVAAAEVGPSDTVLEIGPGVGSLTRHLAQAAQRVVAVELDESLLPALESVLEPFDNVEVVTGDILQIALPRLQLPIGYKVVANIPYYITSAVIRHLLEAPARPTTIVLTIQREVAERLCAQPDDMSLLAVSVQFYSRPRIVAHLAAGAFYPRPNVDSAVVRLDVWPEPVVAVPSTEAFFDVVRAGFSQKRKQIRNALSGGLGLPTTAVDAWLAQTSVAPSRRAETLTLEEWGELTRSAPTRA